MIERGKGGAIVHVSTIGSKYGVKNLTAYCASKGALDQAMRVMALELGPHQVIHSLIPIRLHQHSIKKRC